MKKIEIKVITRAKKEEIQKLGENNYRIKVSAPPEKGRANEKVIELLSEEFGVPRNQIKIISGETSNKKIVGIGNG
ncbi:MAG: DUF167 domain-containing protein [Candidatus Omnitrophota bacterium]